MPWTTSNCLFSFIYSLFLNFVNLFKFTEIQVLEYVNFNAENEERRIEMDPVSISNSLVSQPRHQTWEPTLNSLTAGFDGNGRQEEHQASAEITTPQQREIAIPEPNFQLDQALPAQTMDPDETFKSGVKVASWATSISASGVTAVWTEFLVNQPNTPKCRFFAKASLLSMSASFISGLFIFILSFIRPKFKANPIIVKILMFVASGSTTLVVGFGVAFYFQKSG